MTYAQSRSPAGAPAEPQQPTLTSRLAAVERELAQLEAIDARSSSELALLWDQVELFPSQSVTVAAATLAALLLAAVAGVAALARPKRHGGPRVDGEDSGLPHTWHASSAELVVDVTPASEPASSRVVPHVAPAASLTTPRPGSTQDSPAIEVPSPGFGDSRSGELARMFQKAAPARISDYLGLDINLDHVPHIAHSSRQGGATSPSFASTRPPHLHDATDHEELEGALALERTTSFGKQNGYLHVPAGAVIQPARDAWAHAL